MNTAFLTLFYKKDQGCGSSLPTWLILLSRKLPHQTWVIARQEDEETTASRHNIHQQQTFGSTFTTLWEAELFLPFFSVATLSTDIAYISLCRLLTSLLMLKLRNWLLRIISLWSTRIYFFLKIEAILSLLIFHSKWLPIPDQKVLVLMDTPAAMENIKLCARYDFVH